MKASTLLRISRSILVTAGVFIIGYFIVTLFSLLAAFVAMDWNLADHMFNWNLFEDTAGKVLRLGIVISVVVGQVLYWSEFDD